MKNYLARIGGGAIAGAAMLLSLGATPAEARTPGGSYLQTCTNVRAHGDRVVATCRRSDGRWQRTAINNVRNCNGGLANANGQLVCGRRHSPTFGFDRRHRQFQGYGSSHDRRFDRSYRHHNWRGDYYYGR
jgi:phage tail protein X